MRQLIWNSMLTAQMNAIYWNRLACRYAERERWIKIFLAVTSSSTVAAWTFWAQHDTTWKFLSALSAVIAVILPLLDYSGRVERFNKLSTKCAQLRTGYDQLWAQIDDLAPDMIRSMQGQLATKEIDVAELQSTEPVDRELLVHCQEEVLQSRGLA
jgi:hypothetical protein